MFDELVPENAGPKIEYTPTGRIKKTRDPNKKSHHKKVTSSPGAPVGEVLPAEDPIITRFKKRSSALGGAQLTRTGFKLTGKPLEHDEDEEVSDYFYALTSKGGLDIMSSWFLMGLYALFMIARLVVVRTEAGSEFRKFFEPKLAEDERGEEQ